MGLLRKVMRYRGHAERLLSQHGDKVSGGIDKAARTIDQRTKGKHATKIDSARRKARQAVDRYGEGGSHGTHGDRPPRW